MILENKSIIILIFHNGWLYEICTVITTHVIKHKYDHKIMHALFLLMEMLNKYI